MHKIGDAAIEGEGDNKMKVQKRENAGRIRPPKTENRAAHSEKAKKAGQSPSRLKSGVNSS